jgi:hypothetical protein
VVLCHHSMCCCASAYGPIAVAGLQQQWEPATGDNLLPLLQNSIKMTQLCFGWPCCLSVLVSCRFVGEVTHVDATLLRSLVSSSYAKPHLQTICLCCRLLSLYLCFLQVCG